jgi:hypothetical protein
MLKPAPKVPVVEVDNEGLISLMGERVTLFCVNYIYEGILAGVNDTCVLLEDAGIVYETGALKGTGWKDRQALPSKHYVQTAAIESFGVLRPTLT